MLFCGGPNRIKINYSLFPKTYMPVRVPGQQFFQNFKEIFFKNSDNYSADIINIHHLGKNNSRTILGTKMGTLSIDLGLDVTEANLKSDIFLVGIF